MKKVLFFSLCIIIFVLSTFAVVRLISDTDADVQKTDISNNNNNNNTNIITEKFIDVPVLCQYPELPTGCESVAATMVLQYYEEDITSERFARNWLEYSENFYSSKGILYGPDPNKVFAGNPFTKNSYGCFAEPIVNAINRNSINCTAKKSMNGL